jgi:hypothetical protein
MPNLPALPALLLPAARLVRSASLDVDQLNAQNARLFRLVAIPVLDEALGLAAVEEEFDGLVEEPVHHAVEAWLGA